MVKTICKKCNFEMEGRQNKCHNCGKEIILEGKSIKTRMKNVVDIESKEVVKEKIKFIEAEKEEK